MDFGMHDILNFVINVDEEFDVFKFDYDLSILSSIGSIRVKLDEIDKPWLISHRMYGVPELWWFIFLYNGIVRWEDELSEGMVLNYPRLSDFYKLYERYKKA